MTIYFSLGIIFRTINLSKHFCECQQLNSGYLVQQYAPQALRAIFILIQLQRYVESATPFGGKQTVCYSTLFLHPQ